MHKLHNEQEIIARIKQGDEAAFTDLFEHYRDGVYSIAYKLTHSTTLAGEIVTEVFLKIWLRRNDLLEIQNFSAYLFTIVRNDVYKVLKNNAKNYKVTELTDFIENPENNTPDNYIIEKEYSSLLQKAISRLPTQQKKVYQLIKEQDMKREAVANILKIHPETVKFHLARAMENIRAFCIPHLKASIGIIIILLCHA